MTDSPSSLSPPRFVARHLRRVLRSISPDLEATLGRRYWNTRATVKHFLPNLISRLEPRFQRALIWITTSYHRYRGSVLVLDGIKLKANRTLSRFMAEVIWSGKHTRPERTLVHEALTSDDIGLELGGGVGLVAISCAKKIGGARVYSFEANRLLEPLVKENCDLNGVYPHFEFCILGDSESCVTLHVGSDFWVSSLIRTSAHDRTLSVPVKSFNQAVSRIRPTFLIVDIEGAEEDLFRHANLEPFDKIMIELHPSEPGADLTNDVRRRILDAGFEEQRRLDDRWFLYRKSPPRFDCPRLAS